MLFRDSFITINGTEILARATAQNKLIWTKCKTTDLNSDGMSSAEMNALTDATIGSATSTGSVTNSIVNDAGDTTTLYCELNNNEAHGYARTFAVWGKIEGDTEDVIIVVARCGSGVTPVYINDASEGSVKAFVNFSLEITAEQVSAIQVQETDYYASNSALQLEENERIALSERVVTTHSATSAADGDEQTILGIKTFAHLTEFEEGIIATTAKLEYLQKANPNLNGITLTDTIIPHSGVNLGTTSNKFNEINAVHVNAETANTSEFTTDELFTETIDGKDEGVISTRANILPYSDNGYTLGNEDFMFKEGWFNDIYVNQLTTYTRITCDSYLPLNTSGSSVGSSTSKFDNAYIKDIFTDNIYVNNQACFINGFQVEGQILCNSDPVTIDGHIVINEGLGVGGNISAQGEIYSEDNIQAEGDIIAGGVLQAASISNTILPRVTSSSTTTPISNINIGAIIMLFVKSSYTSEKIIKPGDELTATSSTYQFGFAEFVFSQVDPQTGAGTVSCVPYSGGYTGSIKFQALSACKIPASGSGIVLTMRIQ